MRDTLVTIDTGGPGFQRLAVLLDRAPALLAEIHRVHIMTVAAFARIGGFHRAPDVLRQLQAFRLEFFAGIDRSQGTGHTLMGGVGEWDTHS